MSLSRIPIRNVPPARRKRVCGVEWSRVRLQPTTRHDSTLVCSFELYLFVCLCISLTPARVQVMERESRKAWNLRPTSCQGAEDMLGLIAKTAHSQMHVNSLVGG